MPPLGDSRNFASSPEVGAASPGPETWLQDQGQAGEDAEGPSESCAPAPREEGSPQGPDCKIAKQGT